MKKWVNIYFSEYHKDGFYGNDEYCDTEEDANKHLKDNNIKNCVETKEVEVVPGS